MRNIVFNGIPSIQGKSTEEALTILYRHYTESAQFIMQMNKEIEDLKQEVEELRARR